MPSTAPEADALALSISTDPDQFDFDRLHAFIGHESYWAAGIPRATFERAVRNSLAFGVFDGAAQIGFARVVTDRATYAYLCDVFVASSHRGRGVGTWLIQAVLAHPDLQGLRRTCLLTRDAQGLYKQFGFTEFPTPGRFLQRHDPDVYRRA